MGSPLEFVVTVFYCMCILSSYIKFHYSCKDRNACYLIYSLNVMLNCNKHKLLIFVSLWLYVGALILNGHLIGMQTGDAYSPDTWHHHGLCILGFTIVLMVTLLIGAVVCKGKTQTWQRTLSTCFLWSFIKMCLVVLEKCKMCTMTIVHFSPHQIKLAIIFLWYVTRKWN